MQARFLKFHYNGHLHLVQVGEILCVAPSLSREGVLEGSEVTTKDGQRFACDETPTSLATALNTVGED
jgi:hypothetical protein